MDDKPTEEARGIGHYKTNKEAVTTALSDCIAHHTHLENLASFCARREGPIRLGAAKVMGAADRARADQVRVMHMTHERPRWRDCYCGQEQLVGYVASNSDR